MQKTSEENIHLSIQTSWIISSLLELSEESMFK